MTGPKRVGEARCGSSVLMGMLGLVLASPLRRPRVETRNNNRQAAGYRERDH